MVTTDPTTLFPVEQFVPYWVFALEVRRGLDDQLAKRVDGHWAVVIRTSEFHVEIVITFEIDVAQLANNLNRTPFGVGGTPDVLPADARAIRLLFWRACRRT